MRVLLVFPKMYTLANTFELGFEQNNCECIHYDYRDDTKAYEEKIHTHIRKFSHKIRSTWYRIYVTKINKRHLMVFNKYQPDIVLVYNSEMLIPETIIEMKKTAKVCFFLGDSPFYTPMNDYYLHCLFKADHIFSPDTFWMKQLQGLGMQNIHFFLIGSNPKINYPKKTTNSEREKWGADVVFVGSIFASMIGYKRAMFLSKFCNLDFRIYAGKTIERWYSYFPELRGKVIHPQRRITDEELNTILNCCKLYPVDANPGILNGVHVRIFDCIASGILPLVEYRKDVKELFERLGLPIIEDYKNAASIAEHYLNNESERKEILSTLSSFAKTNFSPEISVGKLIEKINH